MNNTTHNQTTRPTALGLGFAKAYCQYIGQRGTSSQAHALIQQIGEDAVRRYCKDRGIKPKMFSRVKRAEGSFTIDFS